MEKTQFFLKLLQKTFLKHEVFYFNLLWEEQVWSKKAEICKTKKSTREIDPHFDPMCRGVRAKVSHFVWFIFHIFRKGLVVQLLAECATYCVANTKCPPCLVKYGVFTRESSYASNLLEDFWWALFFMNSVPSFSSKLLYFLRFRIEFEKHSKPNR